MTKEQSFSKRQLESIAAVIDEKIMPLNMQMELHGKRLDSLTMKVIDHTTRMESIEESLKELPTRNWLLSTLDSYFGELNRHKDELSSMSEILIRHDNLIESNTSEIRKIKMKFKIT